MKPEAIPTNIITGFLGVGKTTAILHLLQQKSAGERWAVLVNEFGEIGIDGSLFAGAINEEQGVFIREVPGGCMCCAAGLPMQIALSVLLARAKPDRLLIEPTGLGHPKEIIETLSAAHYRDALALNNTITLVDARKVSEQTYTDHDIFNQQLEVADVIVANKVDQYADNDFSQLLDYIEARREGASSTMSAQVYPLSDGKIELEWLEGRASAALFDAPSSPSPIQEFSLPQLPKFPDSGYLSVSNKGEGFVSRGWIFKPDFIFDRQKLYALLLGISAERVKGVFITDQGVIGFNKVDDVLTEITLEDSVDSRIELIAENSELFKGLEKLLLACI